LVQAGVIDHPLSFRILAALTRPQGPLHAAELAFPPAASLRTVLMVLRTARPVQHYVTLPEGLTTIQILELLNRTDALSGSLLTPASGPAEGALLPQTYAFERGTPRNAVMERARTAMDRMLTQIWADRAPGLPLTSPRDMLILASIVEHETAKPAERPRVAAVYLNRLRLGMKLQSDPTVIYGESEGGGGVEHKLTRSDLERDTPYNTYQHFGLPPGPIDNPGAASIAAVAHPSPGSELYFVADGTGGHAFAETLEAHERNVARYRAQLTGSVPPAPPIAPPPARSGVMKNTKSHRAILHQRPG
jgi:UPF0755 protein